MKRNMLWVHKYRRTCVFAAAHLEVHLLRAVEYVDHDAQSSAQVFGRLSLAWSATHGQVQGLGQGDVASKPGLFNFSNKWAK